MFTRTGSRRAGVALGLAMTLALGAAGCGGGSDAADTGPKNTDAGPQGDSAWDTVIADAKKEGSVTIYSSQGLDQLEDLGKRFEDEYGIEVTVVRDIDVTLQTTIDAEAKTGKAVADVIAQADPNWASDQADAGAFTPPTGPAFDVAEYDRDANLTEGGDFISSAAVLTFGWNTSLYPDGLEDYDDLLDPALGGGKIGVMAPGSAAVVDFYDNYLTDKFGAEFVDQLAAQEPRIYESSLPMAQALASGEIAVGSFVQVMDDEKAAGAPVESGLSDTVWGAQFHTGVLATAPHPNAAQLLANYMITPSGQEAIARKAASVLPDVKGTVTTLDKVAPQDLAAITPDLVAAFQTRFTDLFT